MIQQQSLIQSHIRSHIHTSTSATTPAHVHTFLFPSFPERDGRLTGRCGCGAEQRAIAVWDTIEQERLIRPGIYRPYLRSGVLIADDGRPEGWG